MHFNALFLTFAAIVYLSGISGCGRQFDNPADPANNGGFYGGIDPEIAGTWDEITRNLSGVQNIDVKALVCRADAFVLNRQEIGAEGFINAHKGKVFAYYSNASEPAYFFDYSLNATGDTLYLTENTTAPYADPLTLHGYRVFIRSQSP